jgi:hypothetical protein
MTLYAGHHCLNVLFIITIFTHIPSLHSNQRDSKSNEKKPTLSEQFQNQISKQQKEAKSGNSKISYKNKRKFKH